MHTIYSNCLTTFIDILGFKDAINQDSNAPQILTMLQSIKNAETNSCNVRTKTSSEIINIEVTPAFTAFSDCIVLSFSEKMYDGNVSWRHAVIETLNIIQQLASLALQNKLLLRGGMAIGNLYHQDNIVFGESLNRAYFLESEIAENPRVIASKEVVDYFNKDKNIGTVECFKKDPDGNFFLDYIPIMIECNPHKLQEYRGIIEKNIIDLKSKNRKKPLGKWVWFKEKIMDVIST